METCTIICVQNEEEEQNQATFRRCQNIPLNSVCIHPQTHFEKFMHFSKKKKVGIRPFPLTREFYQQSIWSDSDRLENKQNSELKLRPLLQHWDGNEQGVNAVPKIVVNLILWYSFGSAYYKAFPKLCPQIP